MAAQEHDRDDSTSFELDQHDVDEQPPREDLLDPDEIEFAEDEGLDVEEANVPERTGDPGRLPDPEELPESQGADIVESERLVEDDADRPPLHDEVPFDEEE
jgi:hypothetical protein